MSIKFEIAKGFEDKGVNLPKRSTANAAGYDFEAVEDVVIKPTLENYDAIQGINYIIDEYNAGKVKDLHSEIKNYVDEFGVKPVLVNTGVKAKFPTDIALYLYNRSSNPKKGLILANGVGVVDADYYGNSNNDGHIMFAFFNLGCESVTIKKGDRIGQGVFQQFFVTDDDDATGERVGGYGSTGR